MLRVEIGTLLLRACLTDRILLSAHQMHQACISAARTLPQRFLEMQRQTHASVFRRWQRGQLACS